MILSFGYDLFLSELLTPVILILLGVGIILTGHVMKSKLMLFSGLLCNITGYICFQITWEYHGLLLSFASLLCLALPGFYLRSISIKKND